MYTCTPTYTHTCAYTKNRSKLSNFKSTYTTRVSALSPNIIGIFTWQAAYTDVKRKIFKIRSLNTTVWSFLSFVWSTWIIQEP